MSRANNGIFILQTLSIVLLQPKKQTIHKNACELKYLFLQNLFLLEFTNCHQLLLVHSLPSIHQHVMFPPGTDGLVWVFRKEISSKEAGYFIHIIFHFLSLFQFIFVIKLSNLNSMEREKWCFFQEKYELRDEKMLTYHKRWFPICIQLSKASSTKSDHCLIGQDQNPNIKQFFNVVISHIASKLGKNNFVL